MSTPLTKEELLQEDHWPEGAVNYWSLDGKEAPSRAEWRYPGGRKILELSFLEKTTEFEPTEAFDEAVAAIDDLEDRKADLRERVAAASRRQDEEERAFAKLRHPNGEDRYSISVERKFAEHQARQFEREWAQLKSDIEKSSARVNAADQFPQATTGLAWGPWKAEDTAMDKDADEDKFYARLYSLYETLYQRRHGGAYPGKQYVAWRWVSPLKGTGDQTQRAGVSNCMKTLLQKRYPSKARRLGAIRVEPVEGWRRKHSVEAAKILGFSIEVIGRFGNRIYKVGKGRVVRVWAADQHAWADPPQFPTEIKTIVPVDSNPVDQYGMQRLGADNHTVKSLFWPTAAGLIVAPPGEPAVMYKEKTVLREVSEMASHLGFEGDTTLIASATGVRYAHWKKESGITKTRRQVEQWKAAQIQPRPWARTLKEAPGIDLNDAYPSSPWVLAIDYRLRYLFPVSGTEIAFSNPPDSILSETGFVTATIIPLHPYVAHQIYGTVGEAIRVQLTTMRLQFWLDESVVSLVQIETAVVCQRRDIVRPFEPDEADKAPGEGKVARKLVGRLIAKNDPNTTIVWDEEEYRNAGEALQETGLWVSGGMKRDYYVIKSKSDRGGAYHIHAYFLDYAAIAMERELYRHDWTRITRVKTDFIGGVAPATVLRGPISEWTGKPLKIPGFWKAETAKELHHQYPDNKPRSIVEIENVGQFTNLLLGGRTLVHGPPGYGKTFHCLEALRDFHPHILTSTRKMARKFERAGFTATTWQHALKPGNKFDRDRVNIFSTIVYMPEVGQIPAEELKTALRYLEATGHTVVMDGDRKQLPPFKGETPFFYLDALERLGKLQRLEWDAIDHRSKDQETADFKRAIRGLETNNEIMDAFREVKGSTLPEAFLAQWHPRDHVYISTHRKRAEIAPLLEEIHKRDFPNEPRRVIYQEGSDRSGEIEERGAFELLPRHCQPLYTSTFHIAQGDTIEEPARVWIWNNRLGDWCENAVYMGMTRVERLSQIGLIED